MHEDREPQDVGLRVRRRPPTAAGLIIGVVAILATIPACSSSSTPTATSHPASTSTPTSSSVTLQQASGAEVAACESDAKVLETALVAYMAEMGTFPTPPSPWSAATYAANFAPLTSDADGGPYMHTPPSSKDYVIEYDSSGHVWIAPPGTYSATYIEGQDFDANPNICLAAVG